MLANGIAYCGRSSRIVSMNVSRKSSRVISFASAGSAMS